jgi:putative ABC transport system ATP-binding protein
VTRTRPGRRAAADQPVVADGEVVTGPEAITGREIVVACQDVARTYGTGPAAVVAVHGATCRVRAGDRIAISGPSGSGKSTLLHLLAGLEQPTGGTVSRPTGQIGVVFQGPSLVPALDVTENTALPLVLAGVPEPEARRRAEAALELVGATSLAGKLPEELSGGQAQRAAVARVLALRPRLILADEPTGQLDRATGQHIVDALLTTADETGAALVITTHDQSVAGRLTERWEMHEGRLLPVRVPPAAAADTASGPADRADRADLPTREPKRPTNLPDRPGSQAATPTSRPTPGPTRPATPPDHASAPPDRPTPRPDRPAPRAEPPASREGDER